MRISDIGREAFHNARDKGFYDQIQELLQHPDLTSAQTDFIRYLWRANRLMLMVSELSEALEGLRHNNMSYEPGSGGVQEELADLQIRLADFAYDEGFPIEYNVLKKHEYNKARPHKHGGKVA